MIDDRPIAAGARPWCRKDSSDCSGGECQRPERPVFSPEFAEVRLVGARWGMRSVASRTLRSCEGAAWGTVGGMLMTVEARGHELNFLSLQFRLGMTAFDSGLFSLNSEFGKT